MSADFLADRRRADAIATSFVARGFEHVDPAILQPAEIFLDLSGEDIRRRLIITQAPEGRELCLRPEFTIPVACGHIEAGRTGASTRYCYAGSVFRTRANAEPAEFIQFGTELFGGGDASADDTIAEDAEAVGLAVDTCRAEGVADTRLRLGDKAVLAAFADGLELSPRWRRRLMLAFGEPGGPAALLQAATQDPAPDTGRRSALLAGLAGADIGAARALVEEMVQIAGIAPVGGRTPQEIAERLLEQAALTATDRLDGRRRDVLLRVLSVSDRPDKAADALMAIARDAGVGIDGAVEAITRRAERMAGDGIDADGMVFDADFARRLDYYTGFVFEIYGSGDAPIVGGGRYDALLGLLGSAGTVPAVGFSLWVERLPEARP